MLDHINETPQVAQSMIHAMPHVNTDSPFINFMIYLGITAGAVGAFSAVDVGVKFGSGCILFSCAILAYRNHKKHGRLLDLQLKQFEEKNNDKKDIPS